MLSLSSRVWDQWSQTQDVTRCDSSYMEHTSRQSQRNMVEARSVVHQQAALMGTGLKGAQRNFLCVEMVFPLPCLAQVCTTSKLGGRITLWHSNHILIFKKTSNKDGLEGERGRRESGRRGRQNMSLSPLLGLMGFQSDHLCAGVT